ncbi:hypothetical protein J8TS2_31340 [Lederbergia ruris]|uniref:Uncharacterized protein n=1 Tax=Lederbergia ruris TaxID=217495 RepID=A0ABQ4KLI8_9BACI|nr:hypothetical protein J8TS2_31340 [Lederbergia ruris]
MGYGGSLFTWIWVSYEKNGFLTLVMGIFNKKWVPCRNYGFLNLSMGFSRNEWGSDLILIKMGFPTKLCASYPKYGFLMNRMGFS